MLDISFNRPIVDVDEETLRAITEIKTNSASDNSLMMNIKSQGLIN